MEAVPRATTWTPSAREEKESQRGQCRAGTAMAPVTRPDCARLPQTLQRQAQSAACAEDMDTRQLSALRKAEVNILHR